jgi:hypothetical protein
MNPMIRNSYPYRVASLVRGYIEWGGRGFAAPSPHFIKQACLLRNGTPSATWIETGTFLGQTTEFLAKHASHVYSIEPEPTLFRNAVNYFGRFANVEIINGTSESVFPQLLPKVSGDVNFWLDGHYSAGPTFKGPKDTPIVEELDEISLHLGRLGKVCVLIDDVRCFHPENPEFSAYPPIDYLVNWARENRLPWHVEHDIFIAAK